MKAVTLKTERLLLRPFLHGDEEDLLATATDSEWARYLVNVPEPFDRQKAKAFIKRVADLSHWEESPSFAVVYQGNVIGAAYLKDLDHANHRAEFGFHVARYFWGKGLVREGAAELLNWAFTDLELNRVYAHVDPRNERAIRVLEKLGMSREGVLRQYVQWRGDYRDMAVWSILRQEWETGKEREHG